MASTNLNIRTDAEVKLLAEKLFEELGMNMSTAVNIFLRQCIRQQGIPFDICLTTAEGKTLGIIEQGRSLAYDKTIKGYSTMEELRRALEDEI